MPKEKKEKKFLMYKNKPLVRRDNIIYYGNPDDRFIVEINIKNSKQVQDLKVSDKVSVKLIDTEGNADINKNIIKMSEKDSLYQALDIGNAWIEKSKEFQLS